MACRCSSFRKKWDGEALRDASVGRRRVNYSRKKRSLSGPAGVGRQVQHVRQHCRNGERASVNAGAAIEWKQRGIMA